MGPVGGSGRSGPVGGSGRSGPVGGSGRCIFLLFGKMCFHDFDWFLL